MIALLNSNTGSSSENKWRGIFWRSLSSPTQRKYFFWRMPAISACLFIRANVQNGSRISECCKIRAAAVKKNNTYLMYCVIFYYFWKRYLLQLNTLSKSPTMKSTFFRLPVGSGLRSCLCIFFFVLCSAASLPAAAVIRYVSAGGTGTGDSCQASSGDLQQNFIDIKPASTS